MKPPTVLRHTYLVAKTCKTVWSWTRVSHGTRSSNAKTGMLSQDLRRRKSQRRRLFLTRGPLIQGSRSQSLDMLTCMLMNGLLCPRGVVLQGVVLQGVVLQLPKGPVTAARRSRLLFILSHTIIELHLGPNLWIHFQSPFLPTIRETSQPPGQHPAWAAVKQLGKP